MRLGDGPYLWYTLSGIPPAPEVLGIYPEPAPDDTHGLISSVRVANIGAVPLARGFTRWRDKIRDASTQLLDELLP